MTSALIIGGTRYLGRHTVDELLEYGYHVDLFNRGNHENPFTDHEQVESYTGDRTEDSTLEKVAEETTPDIVVDLAAYKPAQVRSAVDIFSDVDSYVYVSSIGAYEKTNIVLHEDESPLFSCSPEQATDDSFKTYGPRKAQADRIVSEAAENGVNTMSIRPSMVYGPHDHTGHFNYWVDRAVNHGRVIIPGDGDYICHRCYVEDVGSAIRIVAERGEAGEAYNIADRQPLTKDQTIDLISEVAGKSVRIIHADEGELAKADLSRIDFPLYMQENPFVLSTAKLANLGWESTPVQEAMDRTVTYYQNNGQSEDQHATWPDLEEEQRLIDQIV